MAASVSSFPLGRWPSPCACSIRPSWSGSPPSSGSAYAGHAPRKVAFRWRVDRVTDVRGNKIEYLYYEPSEGSSPCGGYRERASYLSEVRYNFLGSTYYHRLLFIRAARSGSGINDGGPTSGDCWLCRPFYQDDYLRKIKVETWDGAQYRTVRQYVLTYSATSANNTRCLASVKQYDTGAEVGGVYLPPTTFSYTLFDNKGWACSGCGSESWEATTFRYERLTSINNGYGAVTNIAYQIPAGEGGDWNQSARNYRVSTKTVTATSGGYRRDYTYDDTTALRCYDNNNDGICDSGVSSGGSLVGYQCVTETLKTSGGSTTLGMTAHTFKLNWGGDANRYLGREVLAIDKDPSGLPLAKVETTWCVYSATAGGQKRYFPYPQTVKQFMAIGGYLPATPQKKVLNTYDTTFGNLTLVREYLGDTLYRETETTYYPNATAWIVDKPALVTLRDAAGNAAVAQSAATSYDTNSPASDPVWHHLVGVCDQPNGKVYLYVDGILAGSGNIGVDVGIQAQPMPMTIGARKQSDASEYNQQWLGVIDDVAVYDKALSPSQVLSHYYGAQFPPIITLQPTNTVAAENVTVTFYSSAYGAGTLGYQWYRSDGTSPTTPVPGQTAPNLSFTTAAASRAGQQRGGRR